MSTVDVERPSNRGKNRQLVFEKPFTSQMGIPAENTAELYDVIQSGRFSRQQRGKDGQSPVSMFESQFSKWLERDYCLACTSFEAALQLGLRATGAGPGTIVLTSIHAPTQTINAIAAIGAIPYFVELNKNWVIDYLDLENKIAKSSGRYLVVSHMRGHICNMDQIITLAKQHSLTIIEDCSNAMGGRWKGQLVGSFGDVSCFSTSKEALLDCGTGGLLLTDNAEFAARAISTCSSRIVDRPDASWPDIKNFAVTQFEVPGLGLEMDNLRGAVLKSQFVNVDSTIEHRKMQYARLTEALSNCKKVGLREISEDELHISASFQFAIPKLRKSQFPVLIRNCLARGVEVNWFGSPQPAGDTANHNSWSYLGYQQLMADSDAIISKLCELWLPIDFDGDDCFQIGQIIREVIEAF